MTRSPNSNMVHFEIAKPHLYRFYSYTTPDYFKETVPEAAQVAQILKLVREQLSFYGLPSEY